jgi:hypothetical protein
MVLILIASQPGSDIQSLIARMKQPLDEPFAIVESLDEY